MSDMFDRLDRLDMGPMPEEVILRRPTKPKKKKRPSIYIDVDVPPNVEVLRHADPPRRY
ncbi:hypothetical protein IMZ48_39405, partial [Candidatus Bathyarchaeota archaeon]|nr:hypothetical protein [Candidatus Bathyarchaeota archaeon]